MYQFESRVRYSEVDSEKQLTIPALLDYLQDCCTFQSEDLDIGIEYLEQEQVAWVLSSWQIKILKYPKMGEQIKVYTWPYFFKGFYGYRNFTIEDADGNQLVRANSVWIFMDIKRMRPSKIREKVAEAYAKETQEALPGEWAERKLEMPEYGEEKGTVQAARFHIDTNHHMNNGKYILVAEEYLPEDFEVAEIRAEYKKAAVLGDVLHPVVTIEKNQAWVALNDETGSPYANIEFIRR